MHLVRVPPGQSFRAVSSEAENATSRQPNKKGSCTTLDELILESIAQKPKKGNKLQAKDQRDQLHSVARGTS